MAVVDFWYATDSVVSIGTASATALSASESIATYLAALADERDISAFVKDIKISGGERDVEAVKFFGFSEYLHKKRATVVEAAITLKLEGGEATVSDIFDFAYGTKQPVASTGYNRTSLGEKSTNDRPSIALTWTLTSGDDIVAFLIDKAYITSAGEINLEADGTAEQTITIKGLATKAYVEDNYTA